MSAPSDSPRVTPLALPDAACSCSPVLVLSMLLSLHSTGTLQLQANFARLSASSCGRSAALVSCAHSRGVPTSEACSQLRLVSCAHK